MCLGSSRLANWYGRIINPIFDKWLLVSKIKTLAQSSGQSFIFIGILVMPQGVGYRFSVGHLDFPRLMLLLVIGVWFASTVREFVKSKKMQFIGGFNIVAVIVGLILLSAVTSSNVYVSAILATQLCLLWFGFAYAYVSLFDGSENWQKLYKSLLLVFSLLILITACEFALQQYLISPEYRTSFWGIKRYEWFSGRVLIRNNALLIQGPFLWNHTLSGLCAAGSGLAIYALDKEKRWGLVFTYMFVFMLIASGTRAGFAAVAFAFFAYAVWFRFLPILLHFGFATVASNFLFVARTGNNAPIFFTHDLSTAAFINQTTHIDNYEVLAKASDCSSFSSLGVLGVKVMGFCENVLKIDDWWLFGYGFGSFQRPGEVLSTRIPYNDPGLIQLIFLESGVLAGALLLFLLVKATLVGLKYNETKYYAVGIFAWALFALSSWDVWPLLLIMVFVFKIFQHSQVQTANT